MALSQRERYIAIAVGAAFGVFALDRLVLSPYLQERERLASDKATAVKKQTDDRHVLKQQRGRNGPTSRPAGSSPTRRRWSGRCSTG